MSHRKTLNEKMQSGSKINETDRVRAGQKNSIDKKYLTPPDYLSTKAKKLWKRLVKLLDDQGILSNVDLTSLSGYCSSWDHYVEAEKSLKENGLTIVTGSGYVQVRPEVSISRESLKLMKTFATEFGMTPNSRSKMAIDLDDDDDDDFLD